MIHLNASPRTPAMISICMLLQGHYEIDIRVRRKAEALVAAGFRVDVLALQSSSSTSKLYTLNGVNVHTLTLGKKRGSLGRYLYEYLAFFVWVVFKLPSLMRRWQYAVIDVNTLPDFLIFAALFARRKGAKLILDMHEITPEFFISKYKVDPNSRLIRVLQRIEQLSMSYADHVITINEPIQELLQRRGLAKEKSTIIMNSADERLFAEPTIVTAPPRADRSRNAFVLMYHGTLTKIYGLDIAIEAFAKAYERMPGAEFWILGSGPELPELRKQAEELGLSDRVKLLGTVLPHEVEQWLHQCDVGVLATRQDVFLDYSFSNKLSEYIIVGKAVICSRLRTIRYYFTEDALAYFAPGNSSELAETMVTLYNDRDLRARLVERARQELHPIRWEVMKTRYLQLISDLVCRGARRPCA